MACHVPSATVPRGRLSQPHRKVPTLVAVLNLADAQERAAHDLLRRFCTGRWPIWRLLALRWTSLWTSNGRPDVDVPDAPESRAAGLCAAGADSSCAGREGAVGRGAERTITLPLLRRPSAVGNRDGGGTGGIVRWLIAWASAPQRRDQPTC